MRRLKRALRAIAGPMMATIAIASAITAVGTVDPEGGGTAYGAQAPKPTHAVARGARLCGHAAGVRREPRADRRARPLLRAGQPLRVLPDARRGDALARQGAGRPRGLRSRCASSAGTQPSPTGAERAPGGVNYLRGSDPAQWQTQPPHYRDVVYRDLWPGIDLRLREQSGVLKYEFHVRPGARRRTSASRTAAPTAWRSTHAGALQICDRARRPARLGAGLLPGASTARACRSQPLRARRRRRGRRILVRRRRLPARPRAGHRPRRPVHDVPRRQRHEIGAGIAVDAAGNVFVAGTTQSPDFPTTAGAFRRTGAAQNFSDVFVTKLNPAGTALVYSTFVGGSDLDFGNGLAIDAAGNAYVTGTDEVVELPDHRRRVRPQPQHPAELPALRDRQHRRLRRSSSTPPARRSSTRRTSAAPTSTPPRYRGRRLGQRLRHRRDAVGATSRPPPARSAARGAASTTCSSPS